MSDAAKAEAERRHPEDWKTIGGNAAKRSAFIQGAEWQANQPVTDAEIRAAHEAFWASRDLSGGFNAIRAALEAARQEGNHT